MKKLTVVVGMFVAALAVNIVFAQGKTEKIALQGNQLFPEGIITLPSNDILIGGFGDGSIQKIDKDNKVSYFSKPGENGMVIAVGFALDKKNNRLWVANFNFKTASHENVKAYVIDALGQKTLDVYLTEQTNQVDISKLSTGIYNLILESDSKLLYKRIIKTE